MRKILFLLAALAVLLGAAQSQFYTGGDPWWRPLNPQGQTYGMTVGNARPTTNLGPGEFFIDMNAGPSLEMYDGTNWDRFLKSTGALTDNTIPVWDVTAGELEDSLLTDDATNITLAGGQYLSPDGDVPTPTYSFTNDTDSGLFRSGADNVVLAVGGAETMDWNGAAARIYGIGSVATVLDIDHGLTTLVSLTPTLVANDNAGDQRNVLLIDVDIPNGSAGLVNAINIDAVTDDINTIDSAIFVEGGWDSAITITERGSAATANPLANTVWIFLDDSVDYSGAGGVDCWLILRDANGTNNMLFQVTLNGVCP